MGELHGPYNFYQNKVELLFDEDEHIYYRRTPEGLIPQVGVTSAIHIIDKSFALIPWAARMVIEKMLRLMPEELGHTKPLPIDQFLALLEQAKTAPKDKVDEASDIGTMAHNCLERSIRAAIAENKGVVRQLVGPPTEEKALHCCMDAIKWMKAHNLRWLETERKIYSLEYQYAGTMDGQCLVDACHDPSCCFPAISNCFKDRLSIIDWKSSNYLYAGYCYQTAAYQNAYTEEYGTEIEDRWVLRLGKEDGKFQPWHLTKDMFEDDFQTFLACLNLYYWHEKVSDRMKEYNKTKTAQKRTVRRQEKEIQKVNEKQQKVLAKAEKKLTKSKSYDTLVKFLEG